MKWAWQAGKDFGSSKADKAVAQTEVDFLSSQGSLLSPAACLAELGTVKEAECQCPAAGGPAQQGGAKESPSAQAGLCCPGSHLKSHRPLSPSPV